MNKTEFIEELCTLNFDEIE